MRRRRRKMIWRLKTETVTRQRSPASSPLTPAFPHLMLWAVTHPPAYHYINIYIYITPPPSLFVPSHSLFLSCGFVVFPLTSVMTVSGCRHGGVSRPYSPRWRQLPDHPCAATHSCDAGARPDVASAALQAAGGQHDAERHPERPHICCACKQVCG